MKPALLLVPFQPAKSFSIQQFCVPYFYTHWHYHHEIELTLICEGTGTRLVGDSIENFTPGDLVLMGANLPHMWRSDVAYHQNTDGLVAKSIVIHFREDFWGTPFLTLTEMKPIRDLLERAKRGLKITGHTQQLVSQKMGEFVTTEGIHRVIKLLDILSLVEESSDVVMLSSAGFSHSYTQIDAQRMTKIYEYILNRYNQEITLEEIAAVVYISPKSFCRYFKSKTHKTFTQFVSEVRVGQACKLLIDDKISIGQICYEVGFMNLSNFNRQFKAITGLTPAHYRKAYMVG
ncbi:AraC family transcriptional regulator [Spirosoma arcticum]